MGLCFVDLDGPSHHWFLSFTLSRMVALESRSPLGDFSSAVGCEQQKRCISRTAKKPPGGTASTLLGRMIAWGSGKTAFAIYYTQPSQARTGIKGESQGLGSGPCVVVGKDTGPGRLAMVMALTWKSPFSTDLLLWLATIPVGG
jgi:hypothetical protein